MPRDHEVTTWGAMAEAWRIMGIMTVLLPVVIFLPFTSSRDSAPLAIG
jgi:hypothetical protein